MKRNKEEGREGGWKEGRNDPKKREQEKTRERNNRGRGRERRRGGLRDAEARRCKVRSRMPGAPQGRPVLLLTPFSTALPLL